MKTIALCLLTFFGFFIFINIYIHSIALFLDKLGPSRLPYALIGGSLAILLFSVSSSLLANRLKPHRILAFGFLLMASIYTLIYFLDGTPSWQIMLLLPAAYFLGGFMEAASINFASSFFSPLQAKNVLPFISSFYSLGLIGGSFYAVRFQELHLKAGLGLVPAVAMTLLALMVFAVYYYFGRRRLTPSDAAVDEAHSTKRGHLIESIRFIISKSYLFQTLALVVVLLTGIQMLTEFKLQVVLGQNYSGEALTSIFSTVYIIQSSLTFFINFFMSKKLLFRYGVGNMILLQPLLTLGLLVVAGLLHFTPWSVILFYLAFFVPNFSYIPVAINQIHQVVPRHLSQPVFFLTQGALRAIAKVVFAFSLIYYTRNIESEGVINTGLLLLLLVALIVAVYKLRYHYLEKLKYYIYTDNKYLRLQSIELLAEQSNRNKGEVPLRRLLAMPDLDEETVDKTIYTLGVIGNYESLNDLILVLKSRKPKRVYLALNAIQTILRQKRIDLYPVTKHVLLGELEKIFLTNMPLYVKQSVIRSLQFFDMEDVIDFLEKELTNHNPLIQANVIETFGRFNDRGVISLIRPHLASKEKVVRVASIAALWKFSELRMDLIGPTAVILKAKKPEDIHSALHLIKEANLTWEKEFVMRQLLSTNRQIRIHASFAMVRVWGDKNIGLLFREMLNTLRHGDKFLIDFALDQYNKLKQSSKDRIIREIRRQDSQTVEMFYQSFKHSHDVFTSELIELS